MHSLFEFVDVAFPFAKYYNLFHYLVAVGKIIQQAFQVIKLINLINNLNFLRDICVYCKSLNGIFQIGFTNFNVNSVFGAVSRGNLLNFLWPSSAKHESLPLCALYISNNLLDISFETHVKHSICLVQTKEGTRMHVGLSKI